jgi:hypothetical protein
MPDEALLNNLRRRLPDDFSHTMLDGALKEADNPVRAHQFAATHGELMDHVLGLMASDAVAERLILSCGWTDHNS